MLSYQYKEDVRDTYLDMIFLHMSRNAGRMRSNLKSWEKKHVKSNQDNTLQENGLSCRFKEV
jgi:hypothetical protein